jgi:hypothetical protein
MNDPDKALATQLANIESRTGKSVAEIAALIRASGLVKHGEVRKMLQDTLSLGYGDANTLVHVATKSAEELRPDPAEALDTIYAGKKAELRGIHDRFMAEVNRFGPFEIAPKKTYLSLRRKKQFAMVGPATQTRVEVGINATGVTATERLTAMPAGSMCKYKVNLTDADDVDAELMGWVKQAYDEAG